MRDDTAAPPVRISPLHPVAVVVRLATPVARHRVLLQGSVADVPIIRGDITDRAHYRANKEDPKRGNTID